MRYTAEEKKATLEQIIRFEVLEAEHGAKDQDKQAKYCANQQVELFQSLERICGGFDAAMQELNDFSEKNYSRIEAKVLVLGEDA